MAKTVNLAEKMDEKLPQELVAFMRQAGETAALRGEGLYLAGGAVRDLLLDKASFDIDLVVEGDAITLAQQLADEDGKITTHQQFNTAKFKWGQWSIDLATARNESYASPGALPDVEPGRLTDDLKRRDFTINAMAAELSPQSYGRLIDKYSGLKDLRSGLVRVLHDRSFIDDSTRIWRGLRYEQRLDFQLEEHTLQLLQNNIDMLDTVSGDRIRYEIECVLAEELPEKVFHRAAELGVLAKLNPALKAGDWLAEKFSQARKLSAPAQPAPSVYLSLLAYNLRDEEKEQLIEYLRLAKPAAQAVRDGSVMKSRLEKLSTAGLNPSDIYRLLDDLTLQAINAGLAATDSPTARMHIQLFLGRLRYVKPLLTGDDIMQMGIPEGPRIKEILDRLLVARLDGQVRTREDEEAMAGKLG